MGKEKKTAADLESYRAEQRAAKNQADLEQKKKEKRNSIIITVCVIVVAALIIGILAYNRMVDSGYFLRREIAAESENYKVDGAMMTYFFNTNYQSYYAYAQYLGIDTTKSLKNQSSAIGSGTWFDYFVSLTKNYVREVLALCEAARANGLELDSTDRESIKSAIDSLKSTASSRGYSVNQYLVTAFGAGVNVKDVEHCLELSSLATKYSNQFYAGLSYTDEQYNAYYDANKDDFEGVDVITLAIPSTYFTEKDADGNPIGDTSAAIEAAKAQADKIAAAGSEDEFVAAVREYLLSYAGATDENIDAQIERCYSYHVKASSISDAADWAFSANEGETLVTGEDGATQYSVYYLLKPAYRDETLTRNVRHILFTDDTYEDDTKANEVYAEWESAGFTEDKFIELCKEYSEDTGSAENGGLYENVANGDMVTEFNDWLFDDTRKPGDHGIISSSYGWHIMYYVGESDRAEWLNEAEKALQQEDYNNLVSEYSTSITYNDAAINNINA